MLSSLVSLAAFAALAIAQKEPDLSATAATFPPGPQAKSPLLKIITPRGPFKVSIREHPQFPNRTLYYPEKTNATVPVLAWGNGICYKYGRMYAGFLTEIASQGYLVVAPGAPNVLDKNMTTAAWQMESIEWANSWKNSGLKIGKAAVAGHSCGGMETIRNLGGDEDGLITTGIIMNSAATSDQYDDITAPILFIHGGAKDVAKPADKNFDYIKQNRPDLPTFKAVLETGHLGSYWSPRGGIYAETVTKWLDWQLKGSRTAGAYFKGGQQSAAAKRGWKVESSAIDRLEERSARRISRVPKPKSGVQGLSI